MKISALLAKFKDLTGLDFNGFLKKVNLNFEDFIRKQYYKDFDIINECLRYNSVFDNLSKIEILKIPKFSGKNKYVTRPIENSSLHSALNVSKRHKNNFSNFENDKNNFSLEDEERKNNAFYNNIGKLNDTMNCEKNNIFDTSIEFGNNQDSFNEFKNCEPNQNHSSMMEIDEEENNERNHNSNNTLITVNLCEENEDETDNNIDIRDIIEF